MSILKIKKKEQAKDQKVEMNLSQTINNMKSKVNRRDLLFSNIFTMALVCQIFAREPQI